jgi:hypothetical protein
MGIAKHTQEPPLYNAPRSPFPMTPFAVYSATVLLESKRPRVEKFGHFKRSGKLTSFLE